jgi:hypothetical protein
LLRPWPDVYVVISSSWRERRTLQELQGFFSVDLRVRVVGLAPLLKYEGGRSHRQAECLDWLCQHAPNALWLAIDDDPALWDSGDERVVICDPRTGLSEASARAAVERWLRNTAAY